MNKDNVVEFPSQEERDQRSARIKEVREKGSMAEFEAWWHEKFGAWGGKHDRGEDLDVMRILEEINNKLDEFPEVRSALEARDKKMTEETPA